MDFILDFVRTYIANPEFFFPLVMSVIILFLALAVAGIVKSQVFRAILILPLAGLAYAFSTVGSPFEQAFFLNLTSEFLGALLTTIIFTSLLTSDMWTFPIVWLMVLIPSVLFTLNSGVYGNPLSLNLSTDLLGAFIVTTLIKRSWVWSGDTELDELEDESYSGSKKQNKRYQEHLLHADVILTILAHRQEDLERRVAHLRNMLLVIYESTIKQSLRMSNRYSRTLLAVLDYNLPTAPPKNGQVEILLSGASGAVQRVQRQLQEVIEITSENTQLRTTDNSCLLQQLTVTVPDVLFSQVFTDSLQNFIQKWDNAGLHTAADDLRQWLYDLELTTEKHS